jgi:hypothetical protein
LQLAWRRELYRRWVLEVSGGLAPFVHRGHESVCGVFIVGAGHRRQDAAVITEAEVESAVLP